MGQLNEKKKTLKFDENISLLENFVYPKISPSDCYNGGWMIHYCFSVFTEKYYLKPEWKGFFMTEIKRK